MRRRRQMAAFGTRSGGDAIWLLAAPAGLIHRAPRPCLPPRSLSISPPSPSTHPQSVRLPVSLRTLLSPSLPLSISTSSLCLPLTPLYRQVGRPYRFLACASTSLIGLAERAMACPLSPQPPTPHPGQLVSQRLCNKRECASDGLCPRGEETGMKQGERGVTSSTGCRPCTPCRRPRAGVQPVSRARWRSVNPQSSESTAVPKGQERQPPLGKDARRSVSCRERACDSVGGVPPSSTCVRLARLYHGAGYLAKLVAPYWA